MSGLDGKYVTSCNECEDPDNGEFCCNTGVCEVGIFFENDTVGNCIHCGGEMFKEGDYWWHNEQYDIPINERGTIHTGPWIRKNTNKTTFGTMYNPSAYKNMVKK